MPDAITNQMVLQLGLAAPLVIILVYLLWQSNQERRETTTKFLETLQQTIRTNAEAMMQHSNAVTELRHQASNEHRDMVTEMRSLVDALKHNTSQTRGARD